MAGWPAMDLSKSSTSLAAAYIRHHCLQILIQSRGHNNRRFILVWKRKRKGNI
jgi:hypothetical protein